MRNFQNHAVSSRGLLFDQLREDWLESLQSATKRVEESRSWFLHGRGVIERIGVSSRAHAGSHVVHHIFSEKLVVYHQAQLLRKAGINVLKEVIDSASS